MEPHIKDASPVVEPLQRWGRRRREDAIAGSPGIAPAMLEQVLEASLSGTCVIDRRGCIVHVNRVLLATWGYSRQGLIGMSADLLWVSREEWADCVNCAFTAGRWSGTLTARRRDASVVDVRAVISTIHDPETTDVWLLLSCLDVITGGARRGIESVVAAMPERFMDAKEIDRAIDDSLRDLARVCGACRGYLSLFNDPRTLLGTTHEWCMARKRPRRGGFQKIRGDDLPWWIEEILEGRTVLVDGRPGRGEFSGQERRFLERRDITAVLLIPLRLKARVVGFIGFEQDTGGARFRDEDTALLHVAVHIIAGALEQRQSEYVFRESENLYQIVLDAITDAVTVIDTKFTILLANDAFIAWCEEFELATSVAGKDLFSVLPFLSPTVRQQYVRVMRTGRSLTSDRSYQIGDRTIILREIRIPIFEHGEVARIITVTRDITAQKEVEDLRSRAYAQIERNMEQFALLADHIRNPLQAIMGYVEMMDDPGMAEKARQQVHRIDTIIDQLDERWAESRKLSMFWRKYS
ncbi:MAG: PAS domain S-box protein [Methanoculleus sp.]